MLNEWIWERFDDKSQDKKGRKATCPYNDKEQAMQMNK